jgi:CheY-like chemotaxis protein
METGMAEERRRRVLDVGQCRPDHSAIRSAIAGRFDVEVDRVMFVDEALDAMRRTAYDLVLVNRLIFDDNSDGAELIRRAKRDERLRDIPIMLVSNYAEAQSAAVGAGAERGFGKAELHDAATHEKLARFLGAAAR